MNGSTVGKAVAAAAFLAVAAIIAVSVTRAPRESTESEADPLVPGAVPTGEFTIIDLPSGRGGADDLFNAGESWVFRSTDSAGREREYRADTLDPLEAGRIRLTNPSATIPFDDGRIVVRAAEGFIVRRAGGEPESGELVGTVVVTAYRDGQLDPIGTFSTNRLAFQESLLELRTDDPIAIEGQGFLVRSRGLTVRLGDTRSAGPSGLMYLRLHEGGRVEVDPSALASTTRSAGEESPDPSRPLGDKKPPAPPHEAYYRMLAAGDVTMRSGAIVLTGDRAEVVARMIDGALPPDAIRSLEAGDASESEKQAASTSRSQSAGATGPSAQDPFTLTWTAAMELRLVDDRPAELGPPDTDELAVRWFGIGRSGVRVEDSTIGFIADASELRYGATTARLRLLGKPSMHDVSVRSDELGDLRSTHAEIDVGALPDITAWVDGPGTLRPRGNPDAEATVVTWSERADVTALRTHAGEVLLTSVSASGPVRAITPSGTVDAEFGRAVLTEENGSTRVARAILAGGFIAASPDSRESIEAEEAEILFDPPTAGAVAGTPRFARATGAVRITSGEMHIDADAIAAELDTSPEGNLELVSADADGNVSATVATGVVVSGPRIRVDDRQDVFTLSGPGSTVAITDDDQTFAVRCESMELRRSAGRITAVGPGAATINSPATEDAPESSGELGWTEGLIYDDATGIAELVGAVEGSRTVGMVETQRLASPGGATLALHPGVLKEESSTDAHLVSVTLYASADAEAEVEGRWYGASADSDARGPLESVLALRSDEIALDLDHQRLTTPGAGVLVVEDRRERADVTPDATVSGRGTTAFRWAGSFSLDRLAGRAAMREGVRVSHLDAVNTEVTELFARTLEADFTPGAETHGSPTDAEALVRSIVARDDVRLEHRTLSLECSSIDYEAGANRFTARSVGSSRIRGLDRRTGDSFLAELVRIDPRTGEWAGEGVTGITSGR